MARESWTDERLDDLKGEMIGRFNQVDERFDRVEAEIKSSRTELKHELEISRTELKDELEISRTELRGEIKELRGDIKDMQRLMIQGFIGICTLMVTGFGFIGFQ